MQYLDFQHNINHCSVKEEQSMIRTLRRLRQICKDDKRKTDQQNHLKSQRNENMADLLQKVHLVLDAAKVCGVDCSCFAEISL